MQVILIRHGKAQDSSLNIDDRKRELVEKGIETNKRVFNLLKEELGTDLSMTRVWASPLVRAQQTAAILCDVIGKPDFETYDFIAFGTNKQLEEAIYPQDLRSRIILVGHEPTVSQWTRHLTGEVHDFRTSMAVGITLSDGATREGTIDFMIDPKKVK